MGTSSVCAATAGGAFVCFSRDGPAAATNRLLLKKPSWTLQTHRVHLGRFILTSRWRLQNCGDGAVQSFRFRRSQSFGKVAAVSAEETSSQSSKVTDASLATRSWNLNRNVVTSLIAFLLLWIGNLWPESAKPRLESSEAFRYWAHMTCVALCWLSVAFFLQFQVHKWEVTTMAMADGAFDPGGSFCQNTGLGCQIYFL